MNDISPEIPPWLNRLKNLVNETMESIHSEDLRHLRDAVMSIKLWQEGDSGFTSRLLSLIALADMECRARLAFAFPMEAIAFAMWHESEDEDLFFATWGV